MTDADTARMDREANEAHAALQIAENTYRDHYVGTGGLYAERTDAQETERLLRAALVDEARDTFRALPTRTFHAVIAAGGKVHRVSAKGPRFLRQPYCGSSRWNGSLARVVDSPVTCQKCGA